MLLETENSASRGIAAILSEAWVAPRGPEIHCAHQWHNELLRMMPGLNIAVSEGSKRQRTQLYLQPWQVLLIGPEMIRRDFEMLERFDLLTSRH